MNLQARRLRAKDSRELKEDRHTTQLARVMSTRRTTAADVADLIPGTVVEELNNNPNSASARRVARFLELYNTARDLNDSFRLYFDNHEDMRRFLFPSPNLAAFNGKVPHFCTGYTFKIPEIQALNQRLNKVLTELNRLLRKYKSYPTVRHMGFELSDFDITQDWPTRSEQRKNSWEAFAIWWLCNSRNIRWVELFRRCQDCKLWFFASAQHQVYCSDGCRKRYASRSDDFKERRARYMQKYRDREKQRDERTRNSVRHNAKLV